jgi:hypothetical protein
MTDQQPGQESQEQPPAPAQETATQESGLTTEQPDQPAPTEAERNAQAEASGTEQAPNPAPATHATAEEYAQNRPDQNEAEAQRQSELEAQRREHNERAGGGEVKEGEVQAALDEHNERSGGGVPADDSQDQA